MVVHIIIVKTTITTLSSITVTSQRLFGTSPV